MAANAPLALSSVASGLELGPGFVIQASSGLDRSLTDQEARELQAESDRRIEAARIQVGDSVRFLGGWLFDSSILSIDRTRTGLRLTVSEDWADSLAGWYAMRTRHPKYERCQTIMPLRFEFTGVSEVVCRRVDFDNDARLLPADCKKVFEAAQEYLWTEVVAVQAERIQVALNVWSWHVVNNYPYTAILVDAQKLRIRDFRRRNWGRMFGADSLPIFDEAEKIRKNDPTLIYNGEQMEAFLDSVGVPSRSFLISRKRPKPHANFRRRKMIYRSFE